MPAGKGLALVLIAGVLMSGCGGSGESGGDADRGGDPVGATTTPGAASPTPAEFPAAGATGAPDPCGLLTESEVAAAIGDQVTRVEGPSENFLGRVCQWFYPHPFFDGEDGDVAIYVWVGEEFYSPDTDEASITGFEPVAGIADRAHQWPPVAELCTVIFIQGELVVQVTSSGAGDEACLPLARSAADRL